MIHSLVIPAVASTAVGCFRQGQRTCMGDKLASSAHIFAGCSGSWRGKGSGQIQDSLGYYVGGHKRIRDIPRKSPSAFFVFVFFLKSPYHVYFIKKRPIVLFHVSSTRSVLVASVRCRHCPCSSPDLKSLEQDDQNVLVPRVPGALRTVPHLVTRPGLPTRRAK